MTDLPTRETVKGWLDRGWKVGDAELGEGIEMLYGVYLADVAQSYIDGELQTRAEWEATIKRIERLLEGLAEQQAMPDDWWRQVWTDIRDAVGEETDNE